MSFTDLRLVVDDGLLSCCRTTARVRPGTKTREGGRHSIGGSILDSSVDDSGVDEEAYIGKEFGGTSSGEVLGGDLSVNQVDNFVGEQSNVG